MRPTLGTVRGDGVTLACADWPGVGAPIVALHGITSSLMSFVGVGSLLAGARPLWALDLRGHGDSDKPTDAPYDLPQHARDVACAMRARGLGPSVIVGHSFGAYVAAALAATAPELVSSLVFVDGGYPPIPAGVNARAFAEFAMAPSLARVQQRHADLAAHIASWRALPGLDGARADWLHAFAAYDAADDDAVDHDAADRLRGKASVAAIRAGYYDMVGVAAIEARLMRVAVPITLVRAEWGAARGLPAIVPDDAVAAMRACAPDMAVVTVGDANHYTIVLAEPGARVVAGVLTEVRGCD